VRHVHLAQRVGQGLDVLAGGGDLEDNVRWIYFAGLDARLLSTFACFDPTNGHSTLSYLRNALAQASGSSFRSSASTTAIRASATARTS
jgi:hypothetical protein